MLFKKEVWLTPYAMMRTLHIYVPQSIRYSDERYPVLYMYDGHNLFEDETATYPGDSKTIWMLTRSRSSSSASNATTKETAD